jgi:gliding motility-associated-like protein
LPSQSIEGIAGTWSPAIISTALIGTTTYTFTPTNGQCGITTSVDIEITSQIKPGFDAIRICQNSNPPSLPRVSNDGFTGSWSPDTISTAKLGITPYTFTPDAGQCGTATTLNVEITNQVTPLFAPIGPLCQNSPDPTLPTKSLNGIIGSWTPATINTSTIGATNYTFTPTANQCGVKTTMDIFVTAPNLPTFTQVDPICQNSAAPQLPTTSNNGVRGTWSPAKIQTDSVGTRTYTFTPAQLAGQCVAPVTMNITVKPVLRSSTTITICTNQLPYSWNGQTFASAGTYSVSLLSTLGCDSIATLKLIANSFLTSTTRVGICPSLLPYSWNGRTYNAAGTYTTTLQNARGCDSVATLILTSDPVLTSTTDTTVCSTQMPFSWNGDKYNLEGTYSKRMRTSAGCDSIATLILKLAPLPTAYFGGNSRICSGMATIINLNLSGVGPWTVVYSDDSASYTIDSITVSPYKLNVAPSRTTTYRITSVTGNKCLNPNLNIPFTVEVIPSQPGVRYPTEFAQSGTPKQLQVKSRGSSYTMSWNPIVGLSQYAIPNPVFNYNKTTEYTITSRSSMGCVTVDTLLVKIVPETVGNPPPELFVPKAWTPNGDGKNDMLFPFPARIRELKYFRIYNRWGQLMFETNQLLKGWNGIFNGKPQAMDAYSWTLEAIGIDGTIIKRAGNSALLR